jgi:precorrin-2/cobalt-factor-2 C20-methyltransferase
MAISVSDLQVTGTLYGIGVGPGDPELITLKGIRILQSAPVVAFPAGLDDRPGIAQQIITNLVHPHQTQIALDFPYVQDAAVLAAAWQQSAETVWRYLIQGNDVAFVTEGDVSFYSTFTYLAQTLQQAHSHLRVQMVPGVCSPMAAASALGKPLTIRNQQLMVLPALYAVADLETALDCADVVVLMKVKSVYEQVWKILQQRNLLTSSAVVEWASHPGQIIYDNLSDRPCLTLSYFSVMIIYVNHQQSLP